jgi:ABC-2 type transport system permease protein
MNTRAIRAIVRKDLQIALKNKAVIVPVIVVPLIMMILLPGLAIILPTQIGAADEMFEDMQVFMANMPPVMQQQIEGMDGVQVWITLAVVYIFAPFFLIIPLMVSAVIGADSFAGEKERKTLEALLYTPATDTELFLAKVLSALTPAIVVSWGAFILYTLMANVAGWPAMGRVFFPTWSWIVLIVWVVPAAAGLGLSVMVLISSKVTTFQEANQLGGVVVIPILLLLFGQIGGVLYFSAPVVALIGLALWAVDIVLIRLGVKTFQRGELIARL